MYQAAEWAFKCTYLHTLSAGFAHAAVPAAAAPPWARANAARAKPALAVAQPPPAVYAAVGRASAAVGRAARAKPTPAAAQPSPALILVTIYAQSR